MATRAWWQDAVVYQIYPRSFCDASGDGVGDLEGIRRHLDHLVWLGVDALWLSPFYRSPMADFGYDVSDYCDVDPVFGTLDDFDGLVSDAHSRGLKVIVDFVPNHTSDQHPWFVDSRSGRGSAHDDWYWWRDGSSDAPPNNWRAAFTGVGRTEYPPAWTWDEGREQWYLHLFTPEQPDLNWSNPAVRSAMDDVVRFWLARGVDGFRLDAIHCTGKDPALPDLPDNLAAIPESALNDQPVTHSYLSHLRTVVDAWPDPPPRMMIGEVFLLDTKLVPPYLGTADAPELHLTFNFSPVFAPWTAGAWRKQVERVEELWNPIDAWPVWVLSNHDRPRHRTRFGSEARARAAAVMLLTLRGTPFLYAGEELGLEDADIPPDREVDPGGRDGCRAPIPWDASESHGWAGGPDAWLPWPPDADDGRTIAEERDDPSSILHLYRSLLAARRGSAALTTGTFQWLPAPDAVLAYERAAPDGDRRVAVINYADASAAFELPAGDWSVEVATVGTATGVSGALDLAPSEAVLLRPAG